MNNKQAEIMKNRKGFVAALDQSGGSTPKALLAYGVTEDKYSSDEQMFDLVHQMRSRIVSSPSFNSDHILGAILFEHTMDRKVEGLWTGDYLWEKKGIVPILKVDIGLADEVDGVQLMKDMPNLDSLLDRAVERNIFATKMRSVIKKPNPESIEKIVEQQFEVGRQILAKGLVPILEPEVDINSKDKKESEKILKEKLLKHLDTLSEGQLVMLKLTIPSEGGFYTDIINHPKVMRLVALSGGYSREDSVKYLYENPGLIASFSRALVEGLNVKQNDQEFNGMLGDAIKDIYNASIA